MRVFLVAALLLVGCDTREAAPEGKAEASSPAVSSRASVGAAGGAVRFEFQGLSLGTALADAERRKAVTACYDLGFEVNCSLADKGSVGSPFFEHSVSFKGGRFDGFVLFARPDSFEAVLEKMSGRYGPPC